MNILSFLPWCKPAVHRARRRPVDLDALVEAEEDRPLGCGWFDSSHDLEAGLFVREHAEPDTLARELPLAIWLELKLQRCAVH